MIVCYFHPMKGTISAGEVNWFKFTPKFVSTFPVQVFAFTCAQNVIAHHHSPSNFLIIYSFSRFTTNLNRIRNVEWISLWEQHLDQRRWCMKSSLCLDIWRLDPRFEFMIMPRYNLVSYPAGRREYHRHVPINNAVHCHWTTSDCDPRPILISDADPPLPKLLSPCCQRE